MEDNYYKAAYNDFRTQFFTVEELIQGMRVKDIIKLPIPVPVMNQWNIEQNSRFIETILIGQPQSALFFDGSLPQWTVLNGYKRLKAIYSFCDNRYALKGIFFYNDKYENKHFSELPLFIQRKILNYRFQVHILNPGLSDQIRYGIYTSLFDIPSNQIKNYCRSIIFNNNFSILAEACQELKNKFLINPENYSLEELAGNLLVFLLYKQKLLPAINGLYDCNMELLTNRLLSPSYDMWYYIEESSLLYCLGRAFEQWNGRVFPVDIQEMDTILILLTKTPNLNFSEFKRLWEDMKIQRIHQGATFRDNLNRYEYITYKLRI